MHWIILIIAGLFEIAWVISLKYSKGFSKLIPTLLTVIFLAFSMILLGYALKKIPMGTGYAVWTGIGAAGTAILGILLFEESKEVVRLIFLSLIVIGIIGLKFSS